VRPNEFKEKWDGRRLRTDAACAQSGLHTFLWLDSLDGVLQSWIHLAETIYLNTNENDRKASLVPVRDYRYAEEMRRRYPLHHFERSARIMKELRAIKSKYEIEVLQKAINITDQTFRRLLRFIRPGVGEHEIEAEIYHEFIRIDLPARPMVQSLRWRQGKDIHYTANNQNVRMKCFSWISEPNMAGIVRSRTFQ
jgi:Xaa-Pro aminopeptidase